MFGRGHEVVSGGRANNNIYCHQSRAAIGTLCDIIKGLLSNPVVVFGDFIDRMVQGFLHNIFQGLYVKGEISRKCVSSIWPH